MAKNKEELEVIEDGEELVLEEAAIDERPSRREKSEKREKKEKRPPGRFGRKVREVFSELKKVSWPTFKEVVKNTTVVLAVVAAFLVVIFGVDFVLAQGLRALTPAS